MAERKVNKRNFYSHTQGDFYRLLILVPLPQTVLGIQKLSHLSILFVLYWKPVWPFNPIPKTLLSSLHSAARKQRLHLTFVLYYFYFQTTHLKAAVHEANYTGHLCYCIPFSAGSQHGPVKISIHIMGNKKAGHGQNILSLWHLSHQ